MASSGREELRHLRVFEMYYAMGPERSMKALSEKTGVSRVTLGKWRKKFSWDDRIRGRNGEISAKVSELSVTKTAKAISSIRQESLEIVRNTFKKMRRGSGPKIKTPRDLKIMTEIFREFSSLIPDEPGSSRREDQTDRQVAGILAVLEKSGSGGSTRSAVDLLRDLLDKQSGTGQGDKRKSPETAPGPRNVHPLETEEDIEATFEDAGEEEETLEGEGGDLEEGDFEEGDFEGGDFEGGGLEKDDSEEEGDLEENDLEEDGDDNDPFWKEAPEEEE